MGIDGIHSWYTSPQGTAGNAISFTQAMTLDTSGNLGLGETTPTAISSGFTTMHIKGSNGGGIRCGTTSQFYVYSDSANAFLNQTSNGYMSFATNNTERARITSGGSLLVGTTTFPSGVSAGQVFKSTVADWSVTVWNSNATPYGTRIQYDTDSNGTGNEFLLCLGGATTRATIRSNGGLANYQANNVDLSDARTKKEIAPASSMWDKIGALEIVTYKYNDQTHDDVNVGVIAQQVEAVEPVWVDNDGFGETPEGEEPLKTVYTKDIYFAAIKALQEAMARIEQLETKVAALESK